MTEPQTIEELNIWLKNSFTNYKKDIEEIKNVLGIHDDHLKFQNDHINKLEKIKSPRVTVDHFNIAKIRIAELNEQMHKLSKQVSIKEKSVKENIEKFYENVSDVDKKKADISNVNSANKELKNAIIQLNDTINFCATEKQLESFVEDVNKEFNIVRTDIKHLEKRGGRLVEEKLTSFATRFNKRTSKVEHEFNKLKDENKKLVGKTQIKQLVKDINKEFSSIRNDFDEMKDNFRSLRKKGIMPVKKEVKNVLKKEINKEVNKEIKKEMKEVSKKEIKEIPVKQRKKLPFLYLAGNFFMSTAFFCLFAAVGIFFTSYAYLMDSLIFTAIATFVLGIVLRVVMIMKQG